MTVPDPFQADLHAGEAVLRFPYDDRLRLLLRAIPGRRWDPVERAWCVPMEPEAAEALARLLEGLPGEPRISEALAKTLERRRARRRPTECLLELVRPEEGWSLSFATDAPAEILAVLLAHPGARELTSIGRATVPLDEQALGLVERLHGEGRQPRLSHAVARALEGLARREDEQTGGSRERGFSVVSGRSPHAQMWRGSIEADGPPGEPVFLLLGDFERLPASLRERATSVAGGASLPLTLESWEAIDGSLEGWMSNATRRCVDALREGRPAPPAVLELSEVHEDPTFVIAPGHDHGQLEAFARLPGVSSGPSGREPGRRPTLEHARLPAIRADPFCVPDLDRFLVSHETWVAPDALELLQEIREQHAEAAGLVALSCAHDAPLRVRGLGGELKPFQRAGVSYLLERRRAFLADEQGLGKTIEALATLEADGAYPAIVVCPASLKLGWLRELEQWLPGRTVRALSGTGGRTGKRGDASAEMEPHARGSNGFPNADPDGGLDAPGPADITVINYEIVSSRLDELIGLAPRALVIDESHYCKNAGAKRTQAVARLAGAVPPDGLVLALTGTPVMNRPPELVAQLRILGRLAEFGSGAQFGKRFRGPDAHLRLHWHLRARCFVRRLKVDVLPQLPAKTRSVVPVTLDNEPEYRLAERDVVAWLQSQPLDLRELDAKIASALRAERLVRLNALKQLAARGKLHAALAWIHDFCSSGERLVVFARHREIQRAIVERFGGALHILGEDSHAAREQALLAFQGPDSPTNQLIVCSMEVAGHGLTLTRSSNVVFLELDWTPAKHDQAEDRCHRIGQHDAVNATYLLAADTIDETIARLLEDKRAVIGAVTDGREQDEHGVLDALVRELRGTPYRHLRAVA